MIAGGFVAGAGVMLALVQVFSSKPIYGFFFLAVLLICAGAFAALEAWEEEKARQAELRDSAVAAVDAFSNYVVVKLRSSNGDAGAGDRLDLRSKQLLAAMEDLAIAADAGPPTPESRQP